LYTNILISVWVFKTYQPTIFIGKPKFNEPDHTEIVFIRKKAGLAYGNTPP